MPLCGLAVRTVWLVDDLVERYDAVKGGWHGIELTEKQRHELKANGEIARIIDPGN